MKLSALLSYLILDSTIALGQQLLPTSTSTYPYFEAQTLLSKSCQAVASQFDVPVPSPRVQLSLGHRKQFIVSENGVHTTNIIQWSKNLFLAATLAVYLHAAAPVMVQKASLQISRIGNTPVSREDARDKNSESGTKPQTRKPPDEHWSVRYATPEKS